MSEQDDPVSEWLAAARAGSVNAVGEALQACRGYLLLIAEQGLGAELRPKGGASDLVQETFIKAHRHFVHFQGGGDELRAWLRRILLNQLADFRALYLETTKRQSSREVSLGGGDSRAGAVAVRAEGPSPSRQAMDHEEADMVRRLMEKLPDDHRLILRLRYEEGESFEEISRRMDRSVNAVRKLWVRALERLHREWDTTHGQRDPFPG